MNPIKTWKINRVVKESFWEGFWACLGGDPSRGMAVLHYTDGSYYNYNGVRDIAYKAGSDMCLRLLEERDKGQKLRKIHYEPKIPGSVYAECYGEMRVA